MCATNSPFWQKKRHKKNKRGNYTNKDTIFHFPHAPLLFLTCQGLVTRLDEEGEAGGMKIKCKTDSFLDIWKSKKGIENRREQARWRV